MEQEQISAGLMPKIEEGITIKSPQEIARMRAAGKILAEVLAILRERAQPGMTTGDLDAHAAKEIEKRKAKPSFLGYRGYPAHICVSVNDEVVHGIPGKRVLQEGDIVGIDAGVIDGVGVNGPAQAVRALASGALRHLQSGLAQGYLLIMLLGSLAVLGWLVR